MLINLRVNLITLAKCLKRVFVSVFALSLSTLYFLSLPLSVQAQVSNYTLGANDIIDISVYDEVDLSFEDIRILDSGNIYCVKSLL